MKRFLKKLFGLSSPTTKTNRDRRTFRPRVRELESRLLPSSVSWTGAGDGSSWADAKNWSTGTTPATGDDVFISQYTGTVNYAGSDTLHSLYDNGALSVTGSLTLEADSQVTGGPLTLNGNLDQAGGSLGLGGGGTLHGTLTAEAGAQVNFWNGSFTQDGGAPWAGAGSFRIAGATVDTAADWTAPQDLELAGGNLTGAGNLTDNGVFNWTGGTMSGSGTTTIAAGATLSIGVVPSSSSSYYAPVETLDGHTLINAGTATLLPPSGLSFSNGATFTNQGTFDVQGDGGFSSWPWWNSGGSTFDNEGAFLKSAGTGTTTFTVALDNNGTVDVQSGTLALSGGGNNTGTITVEEGDALTFGGGTYELDAGSSLSGAGTVNFSYGIVNLAGTYGVTGTTNISGGTVNFTADTTLGSVTMSGGTLTGPANVTIGGAMTWTGGTMSGSGTTTTDATLTIGTLPSSSSSYSYGTTETLDRRTLDNTGTATLIGAGGLSFANGSTLDNQGTFDVQGDGGFSSWPWWNSGGSTFDNEGAFLKSAGAGTTTFTVALNNSGTVDVQSGTLTVSGGGSSTGAIIVEASNALTFAGGSGYDLKDGSSLTGAGTVNFTYGTVNLGGTYTVSGTTNISGGTANFVTDATLGATALTGGTLTGPANVTVGGPMTWTGGIMSGSGTTTTEATLSIGTLPSSSSSYSYGTTETLDRRTLDNTGTATLIGAGGLSFADGATLNNQGTFDVQGDGGFSSWPWWNSGGSTFNNEGTFLKSTGTGTTSMAVALNNTGTVDVQSGTLALSGGGGSTGTFAVEGTLDFADGTFEAADGTEFSGAGTLVVGAGPGQADLVVTAPTVEIDPVVELRPLGKIGGTGTVRITQYLSWTGGLMEGTGVTQLEGQGVISGPDSKYMDQRILKIEPGATVTWNRGNIFFDNGAVINNEFGAVFTVACDYSLSTLNALTTETFNNYGVFRKEGTGGNTNIMINFNNLAQNGLIPIGANKVEAVSGKLTFWGDGTHSSIFLALENATIDFEGGKQNCNTGTEFTGNGLISNSAGVINVPPGQLVWNMGNFRLWGTGVLEGSQTGDGAFYSFGNFEWSGGRMFNMRFTSAGSMVIDGFVLLDSSTLRNFGTTTWTYGNISLAINQTLCNYLNFGVLDIQSSGNMIDISGSNDWKAPRFVNDSSGRVKKTAGDPTDFKVNVINDGMITKNNFILTFSKSFDGQGSVKP